MPVERPLSGEALRFDLDEEARRAADPESLRRAGRSARTLLKDGPLRITLVVLAPGGSMPQHHTEGPITIHGLRGDLHVIVEGTEYELGVGDLLSIGVDVPHSVRSEDGAAFLLTVAFDGPHGSQAEAAGPG